MIASTSPRSTDNPRPAVVRWLLALLCALALTCAAAPSTAWALYEPGYNGSAKYNPLITVEGKPWAPSYKNVSSHMRIGFDLENDEGLLSAYLEGDLSVYFVFWENGHYYDERIVTPWEPGSEYLVPDAPTGGNVRIEVDYDADKVTYYSTNITVDPNTCGDTAEDDVIWSYDQASATLTISGTGVVKGSDSGDNRPWEHLKSTVRHVVVKDGITKIGKNAFSNFSDLETAELFQAESASTLERIRSYAFYNCDKLASIAIPRSVTNIDDGAFMECDNLKWVVIGNKDVSIGDDVFDRCSSDLEVVLVGSIPLDGASASVPTQTYTGEALKPAATVKHGGKTLRPGIDYTVSYSNNKNAGTASATITGNNAYAGTITATFVINKAKPTVKAKKATVKVKYAKAKKKAQTVANLSVTCDEGKATYKNASSGAAKKFKVNKKNGEVTVPKGTKKGAHKVKVKVAVKAGTNYEKLTETIAFKVKVA